MAIYFTQKGIQKFEKETRELEEKLKGLKFRTQGTVESGGDQWHDNPAFYTLMSDMRAINGALKRQYDILKDFIVVDIPENPEHVCLGSTVIVEENLEKKVYHIAGFGESDPDNDVIAYNTPLAKSMILKKAGDIVNIEAPGKLRSLKIIEVRRYEGK